MKVNGWFVFLALLGLLLAFLVGYQNTQAPLVAAEAKKVEVEAKHQDAMNKLAEQQAQEEAARQKRLKDAQVAEAIRHAQEMNRLKEERYAQLSKVWSFAAYGGVGFVFLMLVFGSFFWASNHWAARAQKERFDRKEAEYRQIILRLSQKIRLLEAEQRRTLELYQRNMRLLQKLEEGSVMRFPASFRGRKHEDYPLAGLPEEGGDGQAPSAVSRKEV